MGVSTRNAVPLLPMEPPPAVLEVAVSSTRLPAMRPLPESLLMLLLAPPPVVVSVTSPVAEMAPTAMFLRVVKLALVSAVPLKSRLCVVPLSVMPKVWFRPLTSNTLAVPDAVVVLVLVTVRSVSAASLATKALRPVLSVSAVVPSRLMALPLPVAPIEPAVPALSDTVPAAMLDPDTPSLVRLAAELMLAEPAAPTSMWPIFTLRWPEKLNASGVLLSTDST